MKIILIFYFISAVSALPTPLSSQNLFNLDSLEDNVSHNQIELQEKTLTKRFIPIFTDPGVFDLSFSGILNKFTAIVDFWGFDTSGLTLLQKLYNSAFARSHLLFKRRVLNLIIQTCNFILTYLPEESVEVNPQLYELNTFGDYDSEGELSANNISQDKNKKFISKEKVNEMLRSTNLIDQLLEMEQNIGESNEVYNLAALKVPERITKIVDFVTQKPLPSSASVPTMTDSSVYYFKVTKEPKIIEARRKANFGEEKINDNEDTMSNKKNEIGVGDINVKKSKREDTYLQDSKRNKEDDQFLKVNKLYNQDFNAIGNKIAKKWIENRLKQLQMQKLEHQFNIIEEIKEEEQALPDGEDLENYYLERAAREDYYGPRLRRSAEGLNTKLIQEDKDKSKVQSSYNEETTSGSQESLESTNIEMSSKGATTVLPNLEEFKIAGDKLESNQDESTIFLTDLKKPDDVETLLPEFGKFSTTEKTPEVSTILSNLEDTTNHQPEISRSNRDEDLLSHINKENTTFLSEESSTISTTNEDFHTATTLSFKDNAEESVKEMAEFKQNEESTTRMTDQQNIKENEGSTTNSNEETNEFILNKEHFAATTDTDFKVITTFHNSKKLFSKGKLNSVTNSETTTVPNFAKFKNGNDLEIGKVETTEEFISTATASALETTTAIRNFENEDREINLSNNEEMDERSEEYNYSEALTTSLPQDKYSIKYNTYGENEKFNIEQIIDEQNNINHDISKDTIGEDDSANEDATTESIEKQSEDSNTDMSSVGNRGTSNTETPLIFETQNIISSNEENSFEENKNSAHENQNEDIGIDKYEISTIKIFKDESEESSTTEGSVEEAEISTFNINEVRNKGNNIDENMITTTELPVEETTSSDVSAHHVVMININEEYQSNNKKDIPDLKIEVKFGNNNASVDVKQDTVEERKTKMAISHIMKIPKKLVLDEKTRNLLNLRAPLTTEKNIAKEEVKNNFVANKEVDNNFKKQGNRLNLSLPRGDFFTSEEYSDEDDVEDLKVVDTLHGIEYGVDREKNEESKNILDSEEHSDDSSEETNIKFNKRLKRFVYNNNISNSKKITKYQEYSTLKRRSILNQIKNNLNLKKESINHEVIPIMGIKSKHIVSVDDQSHKYISKQFSINNKFKRELIEDKKNESQKLRENLITIDNFTTKTPLDLNYNVTSNVLHVIGNENSTINSNNVLTLKNLTDLNKNKTTENEESNGSFKDYPTVFSLVGQKLISELNNGSLDKTLEELGANNFQIDKQRPLKNKVHSDEENTKMESHTFEGNDPKQKGTNIEAIEENQMLKTNTETLAAGSKVEYNEKAKNSTIPEDIPVDSKNLEQHFKNLHKNLEILQQNITNHDEDAENVQRIPIEEKILGSMDENDSKNLFEQLTAKDHFGRIADELDKTIDERNGTGEIKIEETFQGNNKTEEHMNVSNENIDSGNNRTEIHNKKERKEYEPKLTKYDNKSALTKKPLNRENINLFEELTDNINNYELGKEIKDTNLEKSDEGMSDNKEYIEKIPNKEIQKTEDEIDFHQIFQGNNKTGQHMNVSNENIVSGNNRTETDNKKENKKYEPKLTKYDNKSALTKKPLNMENINLFEELTDNINNDELGKEIKDTNLEKSDEGMSDSKEYIQKIPNKEMQKTEDEVDFHQIGDVTGISQTEEDQESEIIGLRNEEILKNIRKKSAEMEMNHVQVRRAEDIAPMSLPETPELKNLQQIITKLEDKISFQDNLKKIEDLDLEITDFFSAVDKVISSSSVSSPISSFQPETVPGELKKDLVIINKPERINLKDGSTKINVDKKVSKIESEIMEKEFITKDEEENNYKDFVKFEYEAKNPESLTGNYKEFLILDKPLPLNLDDLIDEEFLKNQDEKNEEMNHSFLNEENSNEEDVTKEDLSASMEEDGVFLEDLITENGNIIVLANEDAILNFQSSSSSEELSVEESINQLITTENVLDARKNSAEESINQQITTRPEDIVNARTKLVDYEVNDQIKRESEDSLDERRKSKNLPEEDASSYKESIDELVDIMDIYDQISEHLIKRVKKKLNKDDSILEDSDDDGFTADEEELLDIISVELAHRLRALKDQNNSIAEKIAGIIRVAKRLDDENRKISQRRMFDEQEGSVYSESTMIKDKSTDAINEEIVELINKETTEQSHFTTELFDYSNHNTKVNEELDRDSNKQTTIASVYSIESIEKIRRRSEKTTNNIFESTLFQTEETSTLPINQSIEANEELLQETSTQENESSTSYDFDTTTFNEELPALTTIFNKAGVQEDYVSSDFEEEAMITTVQEDNSTTKLPNEETSTYSTSYSNEETSDYSTAVLNDVKGDDLITSTLKEFEEDTLVLTTETISSTDEVSIKFTTDFSEVKDNLITSTLKDFEEGSTEFFTEGIWTTEESISHSITEQNNNREEQSSEKSSLAYEELIYSEVKNHLTTIEQNIENIITTTELPIISESTDDLISSLLENVDTKKLNNSENHFNDNQKKLSVSPILISNTRVISINRSAPNVKEFSENTPLMSTLKDFMKTNDLPKSTLISTMKRVEEHINFGNTSIILIYPQGYDVEDVQKLISFTMKDVNVAKKDSELFKDAILITVTDKEVEIQKEPRVKFFRNGDSETSFNEDDSSSDENNERLTYFSEENNRYFNSEENSSKDISRNTRNILGSGRRKNFQNLTELMQNVIANINGEGNFTVSDFKKKSKKYVQVIVHKSLIIKHTNKQIKYKSNEAFSSEETGEHFNSSFEELNHNYDIKKVRDNSITLNGDKIEASKVAHQKKFQLSNEDVTTSSKNIRKRRQLSTEIFSGAINRFREISPSFQGFTSIPDRRFPYRQNQKYSNIMNDRFQIPLPISREENQQRKYQINNHRSVDRKIYASQNVDTGEILNNGAKKMDHDLKTDNFQDLSGNRQYSQNIHEMPIFSLLPHFNRKVLFRSETENNESNQKVYSNSVLFLFKSLPIYKDNNDFNAKSENEFKQSIQVQDNIEEHLDEVNIRGNFKIGEKQLQNEAIMDFGINNENINSFKNENINLDKSSEFIDDKSVDKNYKEGVKFQISSTVSPNLDLIQLESFNLLPHYVRRNKFNQNDKYFGSSAEALNFPGDLDLPKHHIELNQDIDHTFPLEKIGVSFEENTKNNLKQQEASILGGNEISQTKFMNNKIISPEYLLNQEETIRKQFEEYKSKILSEIGSEEAQNRNNFVDSINSNQNIHAGKIPQFSGENSNTNFNLNQLENKNMFHFSKVSPHTINPQSDLNFNQFQTKKEHSHLFLGKTNQEVPKLPVLENFDLNKENNKHFLNRQEMITQKFQDFKKKLLDNSEQNNEEHFFRLNIPTEKEIFFENMNEVKDPTPCLSNHEILKFDKMNIKSLFDKQGFKIKSLDKMLNSNIEHNDKKDNFNSQLDLNFGFVNNHEDNLHFEPTEPHSDNVEDGRQNLHSFDNAIFEQIILKLQKLNGLNEEKQKKLNEELVALEEKFSMKIPDLGNADFKKLEKLELMEFLRDHNRPEIDAKIKPENNNFKEFTLERNNQKTVYEYLNEHSEENQNLQFNNKKIEDINSNNNNFENLENVEGLDILPKIKSEKTEGVHYFIKLDPYFFNEEEGIDLTNKQNSTSNNLTNGGEDLVKNNNANNLKVKENVYNKNSQILEGVDLITQIVTSKPEGVHYLINLDENRMPMVPYKNSQIVEGVELIEEDESQHEGVHYVFKLDSDSANESKETSDDITSDNGISKEENESIVKILYEHEALTSGEAIVEGLDIIEELGVPEGVHYIIKLDPEVNQSYSNNYTFGKTENITNSPLQETMQDNKTKLELESTEDMVKEKKLKSPTYGESAEEYRNNLGTLATKSTEFTYDSVTPLILKPPKDESTIRNYVDPFNKDISKKTNDENMQNMIFENTNLITQTDVRPAEAVHYKIYLEDEDFKQMNNIQNKEIIEGTDIIAEEVVNRPENVHYKIHFGTEDEEYINKDQNKNEYILQYQNKEETPYIFPNIEERIENKNRDIPEFLEKQRGEEHSNILEGTDVVIQTTNIKPEGVHYKVNLDEEIRTGSQDANNLEGTIELTSTIEENDIDNEMLLEGTNVFGEEFIKNAEGVHYLIDLGNEAVEDLSNIENETTTGFILEDEKENAINVKNIIKTNKDKISNIDMKKNDQTNEIVENLEQHENIHKFLNIDQENPLFSPTSSENNYESLIMEQLKPQEDDQNFNAIKGSITKILDNSHTKEGNIHLNSSSGEITNQEYFNKIQDKYFENLDSDYLDGSNHNGTDPILSKHGLVIDPSAFEKSSEVVVENVLEFDQDEQNIGIIHNQIDPQTERIDLGYQVQSIDEAANQALLNSKVIVEAANKISNIQGNQENPQEVEESNNEMFTIQAQEQLHFFDPEILKQYHIPESQGKVKSEENIKFFNPEILNQYNIPQGVLASLSQTMLPTNSIQEKVRFNNEKIEQMISTIIEDGTVLRKPTKFTNRGDVFDYSDSEEDALLETFEDYGKKKEISPAMLEQHVQKEKQQELRFRLPIMSKEMIKKMFHQQLIKDGTNIENTQIHYSNLKDIDANEEESRIISNVGNQQNLLSRVDDAVDSKENIEINPNSYKEHSFGVLTKNKEENNFNAHTNENVDSTINLEEDDLFRKHLESLAALVRTKEHPKFANIINNRESDIQEMTENKNIDGRNSGTKQHSDPSINPATEQQITTESYFVKNGLRHFSNNQKLNENSKRQQFVSVDENGKKTKDPNFVKRKRLRVKLPRIPIEEVKNEDVGDFLQKHLESLDTVINQTTD